MTETTIAKTQPLSGEVATVVSQLIRMLRRTLFQCPNFIY
jgi:hypothetical protein